MYLRIANPTLSGGDVQMWPMEWQALLSVLPERSRGRSIAALIRENVKPGETKPVRITLTNREISQLQVAIDRLS